MKLRILLAGLLAFFVGIAGTALVATPAHAAPVTVTGSVVDADTSAGIVGASVEADGPDFVEATAAGGGSYSMSLEPGWYWISAWAEGYEGEGIEVEVTEETTTLPPIELVAMADPVTLTGTVVDADTDTGIEFAMVRDDDWDHEAETDEDGSYTIEVTPGDHTFHASADGYHPGSVTLEVTEETTVIPAIALEAMQPGIYVEVYNDTFGGPAANAHVVLQPVGGGPATTVVTDADGLAAFPNPSPGNYTVSVEPGNGLVQSGEPETIQYLDGFEYVYVDVIADLSCEPSSPNLSLTNMGFENGTSGWTLGYQTESIQSVGADSFTSPWEGEKMARLGHSQPSEDEDQPEGPNVMCQDFVVEDPEETFSFNVFTYDYTGFDEFKFDVVVSNPDTGDTLAAYQQGAWGEGTDLKTSGWRGVRLDLSDHVGDTVRLSFRSGGTSDSLYAFWAYVDSADTLPPTVTTTDTVVETETGSVTTDPTTGQMTVSMPTGAPSDLTMKLPAKCVAAGVDPTAVSLILNGGVYPATKAGNFWEATIPADEIASGPLNLTVECPDETTLVAPIGEIVLYDPSGTISDADTGDPIVGAEVTLFKVPGWVAQDAGDAHPANSCQSNLSKAPEDPWSQEAPTDLGVEVGAASPEISPNVNPFVTSSIGYYGWDVAAGCWYVSVEADGYEPLTSPVVGVPPEVTDLDLELTPKYIENETAPTIAGTPTVGQKLTVNKGTWHPADATTTVQWMANGKEISGATATTLALAAVHAGKTITAVVTASRDGFLDATATTNALGPVVNPATTPGCLAAKAGLAKAQAALTKAQTKVTKAKAKLKKAKKSGAPATVKKAKVKKAKAKLKKAKGTSRTAATGLANAKANVGKHC